MPTVEFEGTGIECEEGAVLRDVLLSAEESPHNGPTDTINCGGHSTCGTCAVAVEGPTSDPTGLERWRLSLRPHRSNEGLRLACQTRVRGDLTVEKHEGFWGQHADGGAGERDGDADTGDGAPGTGDGGE